MFNGTSNQVFTTVFFNMLLARNAQDPVNAREIARNNAIYGAQNNRNPYIDHPEYVQAVWNPTADSQAPTAPTSLAVTASTSNSVSLNWAASTDNIGVTGYDVYMNSTLKTTVTGLSTTITGLTASTAYSFYVKAKDAAANSSIASNTVNATTSGVTDTLTASTAYTFSVKAKDAAGNVSASSNVVNVTTIAGGSTATDLLFSEYIESSSNNKALEISNATGSAVNMSIYSIKKQTNGAGAWSTGLALTGTLNNGSKFTIVNSLIALGCYSTGPANLSTSAAEMAFNGNDAIGLFKNGVLIDVIGTFNGGTADFAADVTLRRKSTVTSPTTTFNLATQWDSYAVDTCNNLGSRITTKSNKTTAIVDFSDFKMYPNPSNGNFSIDNSNKVFSVEIYNVLGQKVFEIKNADGSNLSVTNLNKGVYLVKITDDTKSLIKKLIIN